MRQVTLTRQQVINAVSKVLDTNCSNIIGSERSTELAEYVANSLGVKESKLEVKPSFFEMYTNEANLAVYELVASLDKIIRCECKDREEATKIIKSKTNELAKKHREVYDTEPQWAMVDTLKASFESRDWKAPSRWDIT